MGLNNLAVKSCAQRVCSAFWGVWRRFITVTVVPIGIPGEVQKKRCGERPGQDAYAIAGGDTGATFVILGPARGF